MSQPPRAYEWRLNQEGVPKPFEVRETDSTVDQNPQVPSAPETNPRHLNVPPVSNGPRGTRGVPHLRIPEATPPTTPAASFHERERDFTGSRGTSGVSRFQNGSNFNSLRGGDSFQRFEPRVPEVAVDTPPGTPYLLPSPSGSSTMPGTPRTPTMPGSPLGLVHLSLADVEARPLAPQVTRGQRELMANATTMARDHFPPDSGKKISKHRKQKQRFCHLCEKLCTALRRHMRAMHNGEARVKIQCPLPGCSNSTGFWGDRIDNFRQHLRLTHGFTKEQAHEFAEKVKAECSTGR